MMSNKRVLLLIDALSSGGAERQMTYLAILLKKYGYDVRLFTFYDVDVFYKNDLEKNNINIEIHRTGAHPLKRALIIYNTVKKWTPTAVIAYKNGTAKAACIARIFLKYNLIVSERSTTQTMTSSERIKFLLYRFADKIVCNSTSQKSFILNNYPILSNKTVVITNMLDTSQFYPDPDKLINKKLSNNRIIVTARIGKEKNVFRFLEAIKILKNKGVNMFCDWYGRPESSEFYAAVQKCVSELDLSDYITFHSDGNTKIADCYRKADIFCLPSLYEGYPNVLCEAMASGLVCLASEVCDNPNILSEKRFLFNPLSVESIAECIKYALSLETKERINIGVENREKAVALCDESVFANKYFQLF